MLFELCPRPPRPAPGGAQVAFYQIVASFLDVLPIAWPSEFNKVFKVLNFLNFDLLRIAACAFMQVNFYQKWRGYNTFMITVLAIFLTAYMVGLLLATITRAHPVRIKRYRVGLIARTLVFINITCALAAPPSRTSLFRLQRAPHPVRRS